MFVELHILQNFAFSNLNRDLSGAPKDCDFGGYRRNRISSQCTKRAIREHFRSGDIIPPDRIAERTKRLVEDLVERLHQRGKDEIEARAAVEAALRGIKLGIGDDGKTQYLLFLGRAEIQALADACLEHWDALLRSGSDAVEAPAGQRASRRDAKRAAQQALPGQVVNALKEVLDGARAADLALFGRMMADLPDKNIDAACQVAHAFSTNRAKVEFDFYTAVDDLKKDDTPGADMMGTVEFNSACYYRYANIDLDQLKSNLQDDEELAQKTVEAFLQASIEAIPTGKQNSSAAQNPPSFVMAVVRDRGLWSLANAFVRPVAPSRDLDLVQNSVAALDRFWQQMVNMYGDKGFAGVWCAALDDAAVAVKALAGARVGNTGELVQRVLGALSFAQGYGEQP
ncbi:MAG: type I-E CRISPR-associated protein Cas7/Cse4/CasC [Chloroflexi bacterium]|nr:type I-E CRISPR-associated protein Cas7/Cse4/CasC [Chloroflexota bacterium]